MDVKIDCRRIGSYLAGARRRQGLKQKQVADLIDVANNTVSNMERGQQELNLERIVQLCILYEIKPGDVLNDCCDELIAMDTPQEIREDADRTALFKLIRKCPNKMLPVLRTVAEGIVETMK